MNILECCLLVKILKTSLWKKRVRLISNLCKGLFPKHILKDNTWNKQQLHNEELFFFFTSEKSYLEKALRARSWNEWLGSNLPSGKEDMSQFRMITATQVNISWRAFYSEGWTPGCQSPSFCSHSCLGVGWGGVGGMGPWPMMKRQGLVTCYTEALSNFWLLHQHSAILFNFRNNCRITLKTIERAW